MEIKFDKEYLAELYYTGKCSDKRHRFQPDIARRYQRCVDLMESIPNIEGLYQYNSLRYKVLEGDKRGISSVRVSDAYRIEFTVEVQESETLVTICNILELSNHYK
jgi:proteic killer suppression protein